MAVTIKHAKTDNIADWTQADLDAQIALGNFPAGTLIADIVLPSDWNNDHNLTGTVPVANGGTGVTTSSGANSVVLRDANANITTNCLFEGYTTQAASGTTIVLTASSAQNFQITGSGGQTIKLPDATTLPNGALFTFNNNQSSGTIIVQNNSSTTVDTLQSGAFSTVVLLDNSTAAGSWDRHNQSPSNVSWSTNTFDYPGSITSATWNGSVIALNRGGTNANLTAVNGGAVYSTGTALAITAAGTAGQVLQSNGAAAPTWVTSPTAGAGGSNTQIQYNNSGVLAGSANFTFNGTTVTTANDLSVSGITVGIGAGAISTNVAMGGSALASNTTGAFNVAIGNQALNKNTTANNNVAIGLSASLNNTIGTTNVAVGRSALLNNTTGSSNTGLGYFALSSATTAVATLGSITGGSGYTNGSYGPVAMSAVSGATFVTYPTVNVTVSGGAVTAVTLVTNGVGASSTAATVLTVAAALIGGTGSGFSIPVATFATGGNNTAVGYQALQANTTASSSTAIGYAALLNNTTGAQNTAVGTQALQANTTGTTSTAVGYQAAISTTTANVDAFGYQALRFNTTGTNNAAFARGALSGNILGANNTAVGFSALTANTTNVATLGSITAGGTGYNGGASGGPLTVQASLSSGSAATTYPTLSITVTSGVITAATLVTNGVGFVDTTTVLTVTSAAMVTAGFAAGGSGFTVPVATLQSGGNNTAIGYQALTANTTGSSNVGVGLQALNLNTTGAQNVAIGQAALAANTTASNSVAVGHQALQSSTGTGGNIAMGYRAGNAITSGTTNTILGHVAAFSGTNNLTTGSNNTIIGYNAAASAAGVSNEITLGNSSCTSLRLAPLITGYTSAAPTIASAATIAPTKPISFVSGTTTIDTITAPAPLTGGGGSITLIPTGIFATSILGNIALATTAVVGKALILTYDATTTKWYPSY